MKSKEEIEQKLEEINARNLRLTNEIKAADMFKAYILNDEKWMLKTMKAALEWVLEEEK